MRRHLLDHEPADSVQLLQDKAKSAQWLHVEELSPRKRLAFDHGQILQAALERLRSKVEYTSLPAFLLPEPFTLPQFQKVYEVMLGRPTDKSGFRTRALAADFLKEDGFLDVRSPRPAMGYSLKTRESLVYFLRTLVQGVFSK